MFKIESYVTPILLSYVDKYVRDFKPADAQVSLWGGGVALHNLVLKPDVLQQEVALPFTLVSGRIHELLIQVPWTKIMSEPIVVSIDTIECILNLTEPSTAGDDNVSETSQKTQVVEAPPGYMQALVRRIVSNITLRVHHLIVKYVQDDIVMSLNVKHLIVDSAGANWEPTFADIDQAKPVIRRLMRLDDLTLCLDRADDDGKIRFYQEPLLYRCQLEFRILTTLVSANTRRVKSLSIELRSSNVAWCVTSDQMSLLIRLIKERAAVAEKSPPVKKNDTQTTLTSSQAANSAEPAYTESWAEWAWSWLPSLSDRDGTIEDAPPVPVPIYFAAYFDNFNVVFKVMETDANNRSRARGVLELNTSSTALKSFICKPTIMQMRAGTRSFTLQSRGKCSCGHMDYDILSDAPTVYVYKKETEKEEETEEWKWPEDHLSQVVETALKVDEQYKSPVEPGQQTPVSLPKLDPGQPEEPTATHEQNEPKDDSTDFWKKMAPQLYVEYIHERSPPDITTNPYENPPIDFQYSDWVEECNLKIQLQPIEVRIGMGLIHRLSAIGTLFKGLSLPTIEEPKRTLTVEECEALSENLPQRRINFESLGINIHVHPWDHNSVERSMPPPLILALTLPKSTVIVVGPLYPHRVCSAASQMPGDIGPLWQAARLHITANIESVQAKICSTSDSKARPCGRVDLRAVIHVLMKKEYFSKRESVSLGYSVKIKEANVCGSPARLQAAWQVPLSLCNQRPSTILRFTTLAMDALNDEELVAVDLTVEELIARGFFTPNTTTHIVTLQAMKATMLHEKRGCDLKQAWLLSAPDSCTNNPYLRMAVQWCKTALPHSIEYAGLWMEPTAVAIDPLFIGWLAYRPSLVTMETLQSMASLRSFTSQYAIRRRTPATSSSGRGGSRSGSGAEVHGHGRSVGSSDKPEIRVNKKTAPQAKSFLDKYWGSDALLVVHERLQRMLVNVEIGLAMVYVTLTSASALDCATVRDAMERHASMSEDVIALSFGRLSMNSSTLTKQFWNDIEHNGPTFVVPRTDHQPREESFPWKLRLCDVSCYTLEVTTAAPTSDKSGRTAGRLRSQLRTTCIAKPRTVLELVTSTMTVSMVTKQLQIKQPVPMRENVKKEKEPTVEEARLKYFRKGMDFKPTTLKEFVRGPASRKKDETREPEKKPDLKPKEVINNGPVVSLGIHVHADTPPLIIRLEQDQMPVIAATVHCFTHILALLKRPPLNIPKVPSSLFGSHRSLARSVSELEELNSPSESLSEKSELISIYEALSAQDLSAIHIRTFFWFQWVINRVTLVATTKQLKLAFNMDDIISSVDLQAHYNQLKIKVASASVKHYARTGSDEWTAGVLSGRVLEAREPVDAKADENFLAITFTEAQVSNLPASWRAELHPKMLENKSSVDCMWEIYATLAPLEALIQPKVLDQIIRLVLEIAPRSSCPLVQEVEPSVDNGQWPFCYLNAGGLRLLLTVEDEAPHKNEKEKDDTFIFVIGKVGVSPYPDNPICRHPITDSGRGQSTGGLEGGQYEMDGCQYELTVKNVAIRCAKFSQLVEQEAIEAEMSPGTSGENPAVKWTKRTVRPDITPVLHSVDISFILAPPLYVNGLLTCGPAVELNLVSDCALELSLDQLVMAQKVVNSAARTMMERKASVLVLDEDKSGVCPYATLLRSPNASEDLSYSSNATLDEDGEKSTTDFAYGADSGTDSIATSMKNQARNFEESTIGLKKSVSIAFFEPLPKPSEYLEVFVTMGMIELSLYAEDDGSPEIVELRPPPQWGDNVEPTKTPLIEVVIEEDSKRKDSVSEESIEFLDVGGQSARSLTETVRNVDVGQIKFEHYPEARKNEGNLPLVHITLYQPNLYYWRKKTLKSIQVSLFNAWVGLGAGKFLDYWNAVLLDTSKGVADPVTDIPPALATMKILVPISAGQNQSSTVRGSIQLDVERPVMLEISSDRLRRLKAIYELVKSKKLPLLIDPLLHPGTQPLHASPKDAPVLYQLKHILMKQYVESMTVQMTQVCVNGSQGAAGWDSLSLQVATGGRPERLVARALVTAATVVTGAPNETRHVVVQPAIIGLELQASWESWRLAEGGFSAREPTVQMILDLDSITLDLRPSDLAAVVRIRDSFKDFVKEIGDPESLASSTVLLEPSHSDEPRSSPALSKLNSVQKTASEEHFYKDDLRSGAFALVCGGQVPMAYQVTLHDATVSWRYPHPRAVTRLVLFPLPGQEVETPCVLELYSPMLSRWETHTLFSVPVGEPREVPLYVPSPDAIFAQIWRFRVMEKDEQPPSFEFDIKKYMPRNEPLADEASREPPLPKLSCTVTAEQLSGVVRVDSVFSPQLQPRLRIITRVAHLAVFLHNALPPITRQPAGLEGYYVSKPLRRSHRVLSVCMRDATLQSRLASPAGALFLLNTNLSSDILDCASGTMEQLVEEVSVRGGVSAAAGARPRARVALSRMRVGLVLPRVRTLHSLANDWRASVSLNLHKIEDEAPEIEGKTNEETFEKTSEALEGRISLWIHNSSATALRVGQEETDEVVPLGPETRIAYRWRSPMAPKRLRFALAGPSPDSFWSTCIPFAVDHYRLKLVESESVGGRRVGPGAKSDECYLYVRVRERGSRRCMRIAGRLCLANMLRRELLYKLRTRSADPSQCRTVCSGELVAESIGRSIICSADHEMSLKIRFAGHDAAWSGDIPLKECHKENVPWLVKVPCEGELPYVSVWGRVVRAQSDGRVFVTIWPLYVLRSHLPLDTDVLIMTERVVPTPPKALEVPTLVQTAPGRGACTHLLVPGTAATRHTLSFQYRNIECPVTKEEVPLHYGVTETSVFDKTIPTVTLESALAGTQTWLERSERHVPTSWPYSTVAQHWPGEWKAAVLQPRCDVNVQYRAVRAGSGCSLEVQLCPAVLLCNAAPIALTLRAHDAAPLCRLEPGNAISPPSAVLTKPFFISVEKGRETFVSCELSVSGAELGQYGRAPPGRVALDRTAEFAVQCNHKVALLTMYYEIKEDINILGMTSTYTLINRMNRDLLATVMAVHIEDEDEVVLRPSPFKVYEPTPEGNMHGTPLCKFWMVGRVWRGTVLSELQLYLYAALPSGESPALVSPVRLGLPPVRRALALTDYTGASIPVVVTQIKHGGRWVITVAPDPCPQLLLHNRTNAALAVAQPAQPVEPSSSNIKITPDCIGMHWCCVVNPGGMTHYSTPSYCLRYPQTNNSASETTVTFLTFAKCKEMINLKWCAPVAAADGEQLLQLADGETVKMRVRTHPHSTLIELRDVDQHDISASDIRKRLLGAFSSDNNMVTSSFIKTESITRLERTAAERNLSVQSMGCVDSPPQQATGNKDLSAQATESSQATKLIQTTKSVSMIESNQVTDQNQATEQSLGIVPRQVTELSLAPERILTTEPSQTTKPIQTTESNYLTDLSQVAEQRLVTVSSQVTEPNLATKRSVLPEASQATIPSPPELSRASGQVLPTESNQAAVSEAYENSLAAEATRLAELGQAILRDLANKLSPGSVQDPAIGTGQVTDSGQKTEVSLIAKSSQEIKLEMPSTSYQEIKLNVPTTARQNIELEMPTTISQKIELEMPTTSSKKIELEMPTTSNQEIKLKMPTTFNREIKLDMPTTSNKENKSTQVTAHHLPLKTCQLNNPCDKTKTCQKIKLTKSVQAVNLEQLLQLGTIVKPARLGMSNRLGQVKKSDTLTRPGQDAESDKLNRLGQVKKSDKLVRRGQETESDKLNMLSQVTKLDHLTTPSHKTTSGQAKTETEQDQATEPNQTTEVGQYIRTGQAIKSVRTHGKSGQSPVKNPPAKTRPMQQANVAATDSCKKLGDAYASRLLLAPNESTEQKNVSENRLRAESSLSAEDNVLQAVPDNDWDETANWRACDRLRVVASSITIEVAVDSDTRPLIALHLDRAAVVIKSDSRKIKTTLSIADVQVDNVQYDTDQFDFAVVATTRSESERAGEPWPPLWSLFSERRAFSARRQHARALLLLTHDSWTLLERTYTELTEVELRVGPLALYIEDAYLHALAAVVSVACGEHVSNNETTLRAEERVLIAPLRLRSLTIHPLDLTLTLHTAVRMYIALDQSPLHLNEFKITDTMTSAERLTHTLTVHYLSAAILGAGWVVGGLELLGAPGAAAARVVCARGGVRGVAAAAAAALLHSVSACAGSLARNLDLLAGDEEHARRAAAKRRRAPATLLDGLFTGLANFAVNMLGAVGGLAHHPIVGVAVGESESGATALRRSLVGVFAKPLSATADLVAYAGHGLLTQTGWDSVPRPRAFPAPAAEEPAGGWRRDCVRWTFRLGELPALAGFHVLLDGAPVLLLITHKYLMMADLETERIVEMIDFKFCSIGPYQGQIIQLMVSLKQLTKMNEMRAPNNEDEVQRNAAAMARVARYTGAAAGAAPASEARALRLLPAPGLALALHAALAAAAINNSDTHFALL